MLYFFVNDCCFPELVFRARAPASFAASVALEIEAGLASFIRSDVVTCNSRR